MNARRWDQTPIVLVVDDEMLIRLMAAEYLRDCGFHVLEASSADEAIGVLISEHHIDVLFSDVRMPGSMNGFQLAQWVRTHRPTTEIILASGYADKDEASAHLFNPSDVLAKPYEFLVLSRRIQSLLATARSG